MEGTTSEMLETVLSNKVLDTETPVRYEDVLSSPTCTQPSLQNDQSKSAVAFSASVEACTGAKQESAKLINSPMHDTKSVYSSSVGSSFHSYRVVYLYDAAISICLVRWSFFHKASLMVIVMLYHPF